MGMPILKHQKLGHLIIFRWQANGGRHVEYKMFNPPCNEKSRVIYISTTK
jgi:hypothetical protein